VKVLAIIGGGSWGTALALALAPRFPEIRLWVYEQDLCERMQQTRVNDVYLPGFELPSHIRSTNSLAEALDEAEIVLSVTPSHLTRGIYEQMLPELCPEQIFVSATKGVETGSLLRMSEMLRAVICSRFEPRIAVLSGPTFAREVAQNEPTALVVASSEAATAAQVQMAF
jgi:glycerol-3-phosphate dehydrogenase (NAD(P)+)